MPHDRIVGPGRHPSAGRRDLAITVLTPDGPIVIIAHDKETRSEIARHLNAVRRYVETGDDRRLQRFTSRRITLENGTKLEFVTDRATIDRFAEGSAIHFELYRR